MSNDQKENMENEASLGQSNVVEPVFESEQEEALNPVEDCKTSEENYDPDEELPQVKTEDVDVISYVGPISREGYTKLTKIIESKTQNDTKRNSLILVLTTGGGDPDYGYRIGRAINHYYNETTILIPDVCKSAGTLVAIAGQSLIIGDLGELGPLDIQFRKADEMGEQSSTLNIFKTVNELQNATIESFRHFVTDIRYGSGIGTKLSSEIASNLTKAMISPIAAQIDPIKLGEHNRALQIAKDYATRLNQIANNLVSAEALEQLISGYPCHSFVIDRKEAKQIFENVRKPHNEREAFIYLFSRHYLEKVVYSKGPYLNSLQVVDFEEIVRSFTKDENSPEEEDSDFPEQHQDECVLENEEAQG